MYQQTTLNFKIKKWLHQRDAVMSMFLEDWIDSTTKDYSWSFSEWSEERRPAAFAVDFVHREDAMALKLKGIPIQFQEFFEIQ
jgi:hypothetical protein